MQQEIDFYTRRNKIGWQPLESPTPFNEALWPHVLAKVSSDPSMLHFFLKEACAIVSNANSQGSTEIEGPKKKQKVVHDDFAT